MGQSAEMPLYTNADVTASRAYRKGNNYQKDLLLFVDLLQNCHPAFAPDRPAPFDLQSERKQGYRWARTCGSDARFRSYLQGIVSRLRDGHSSLLPMLDYGRIYPFAVLPVNGRIVLQAVDKRYAQWLGQEITQINGHDTEEVLAGFEPLISSDNAVYFRTKVGGYMQFASNWEGNPYRMEDETLVLTFADKREIRLHPVPKQELDIAWTMPQRPVSTLFEKTKQPFSYRLYPDLDLCYMEFNACTDQSVLRLQVQRQGTRHKLSEQELEQRLASVPRFDVFVQKMFAEIAEKRIGNLVIDVRNNSGGNSRIGDILLSWLKPADQLNTYTASIRFSSLWQANYPELALKYEAAFAGAGEPFVLGESYDAQWLASILPEDTPDDEESKSYFRMNTDERAIFKGRIYIIQGSQTYSSAGMFLTTAYDNQIGEVIGECSSFRPCHYGDLLSWRLPNTGVSGYLSHKLFSRPDRSECAAPCLVPHTVIETDYEGMLHGVDACEQWILEQIKTVDTEGLCSDN